MEVEKLLRNSMRNKPTSKRGARQKTSTPKDVIRMNYNENPYGMSPKVKQALIDSVAGASMYQDFYGVDLRCAIADEYGLTEDCVLIGSGSSASIDMIGEVFINEGDEVVLSDRSYEAFPDMVYDNGGSVVTVATDEEYGFRLDAMLNAITDKTKIVVIVNPNNPTGTCLQAKDLEEFIRKVPSHVLTVVDEAYFDYVAYPNYYSMIRMIQEKYDKPLIVLRTFSKIYGLAGIRIGYAIAKPEIIDHLMKACQAWNVGRTAQVAAFTALKDKEFIRDMHKRNLHSREILEAKLEELGCQVVPSQANFIYFKVPNCSPKEVKEGLAQKKIMIGAPDDHNRVSIGTEVQNKLFLEGLEEIISEKEEPWRISI